MATKKRQSFCGRPGCNVARAVHHILARACGGFVEPGSKEAHELRRAHLALIAGPCPHGNPAGTCMTCETGLAVPEAIEDEKTAKVALPSTPAGVWNHMVKVVDR